MEKTFWQVAASDVYGSCRVATSHLKPVVKSDQSVAWSVKILVVVAKARCSGCFAATVHLSPHPRNRGVCAKISDSTSSRCQVCHVSLRRQQLIEIKPNGSAKPLSLDAWMWFWFLLSVNLFFGVDASIWVTAPQALLSTVMHRFAQDVWSPEHCIGKYSSKFHFFLMFYPTSCHMAKFEGQFTSRINDLTHWCQPVDFHRFFFAMCCLDGQGSLLQSLPTPIQGQRKDSGFWSSYEVATADISHHFDALCRAMCSRTSLQSFNLPCPF